MHGFIMLKKHNCFDIVSFPSKDGGRKEIWHHRANKIFEGAKKVQEGQVAWHLQTTKQRPKHIFFYFKIGATTFSSP